MSDKGANASSSEASDECAEAFSYAIAREFEDGGPSESTSSNQEVTWKGVSLEKILISNDPFKWDHLPPISSTRNHQVLFELPIPREGQPKPYPDFFVDKWALGYVRLPHSSHSLYVENESENRRRWEVIQEALVGPISSSFELETAILSYNQVYAERWDFRALHNFFKSIDEEETDKCFSEVIPNMARLALRLPDLLTGIIPLLRRHSTSSLSLSQLQVASLLANAFFCTFPRRNTTNPKSEYANYPYINFNKLFGTSESSSVIEKLKCIFHYFRRVTDEEPKGVITIHRQCIPRKEFPRWDKQTSKLPLMHITNKGTIETEGSGFLQVDFANKFVGGGVLNYGCVQEEIRFVICPELLVTMLVTEALDDNEALIINGVERYSQYKGYSDSFTWEGNFVDSTPRDKSGRLKTCIVAIDAISFRQKNTQFNTGSIIRELNKAYAGFYSKSDKPLAAVATGNWGCGAFRGNPELKALIQLMAAGVAGRSVMYFTFGDEKLRDRVAEMYQHLVRLDINIGRLFTLICQYQNDCDIEKVDFYQYLTIQSKIKPLTHYFSKKNHTIKEKSTINHNTDKKIQSESSSQKHPSIAKLQEEEREREIEEFLKSTELESLEDNNKLLIEKINPLLEKKILKEDENEIKSDEDSEEDTRPAKRKRPMFSEVFGEKVYVDQSKTKISPLDVFNELLLEEKKNASRTSKPLFEDRNHAFEGELTQSIEPLVEGGLSDPNRSFQDESENDVSKTFLDMAKDEENIFESQSPKSKSSDPVAENKLKDKKYAVPEKSSQATKSPFKIGFNGNERIFKGKNSQKKISDFFKKDGK